jgi:hypothetical protein
MHPKAVNAQLNALQQLGLSAKRDSLAKRKQSAGGRELAKLAPGDRIVLQNPLTGIWNNKGVVQSIRPSGRSYVLAIDGKAAPVIRNRHLLRLHCPPPAQPRSTLQDSRNASSTGPMGPIDLVPALRRSSRIAKARSDKAKTVRFQLP